MSRWILCSILPLAGVLLAGCGGSAVLVARTRNGGVVGLEGDRAQAMADARRQMSEQCDGAYVIVQQGNAVTGYYRGEPISEYLVEYACGAGGER